MARKKTITEDKKEVVEEKVIEEKVVEEKVIEEKVIEEKEEVIEDKKVEAKKEVKEDTNIIECVVIASNFGRFQTGETLELAKEIFAKYENLGYLKRK